MYSMNRTSAPIAFPYSIRSHDLIVVDTADDDRVDLERAAEHALRRGHSFMHAGELVESRERLEPVGTQGVQADGDAAQAGGRERVGVLGEQDAVGRQREVVEAALAGQHLHEFGEVAPEQRLAARQPQAIDAFGKEDVDERRDLLEVQDVLARQPVRTRPRACSIRSAGCTGR